MKENKLEELIKKLCPNGVEYKKLEDCCNILDNERKPVTKSARIKGEYPYYGANGIQDYVSDYILDGTFVLVGEDGSVINKNGNPVVTWAEGKIWVNNHAHVIKEKENVLLRYLYHYIQTINVSVLIHGNIPKLNQGDFRNLRIAVPPLEVQCEIVHILDDFTLLSAELSAELKARQKQYEYYLYKLISDSKKITKNKLYELTIWDKKFNAVENYMQPNVKKYPTLLAVDLFNLERENGNVFLLSTGGQRGWTTEEVAGDNISEGEVVTIPWGKSRPVQEVMKYYCGKFVTGDNRIATSNDIKKLNNKYLFYWMQTQSERIDKFYRGSGIQHPNMRNVLTLEIELPSIDEQKRIVSILDKFEKLCNDISQGLPAEIEARQKQYEYYRDKLLTFKELKVNE